MSCPILFAGIILIGWKSFIFNSSTIMYMSTLFIVALFWGIKQYKSRKKKIEQLHKEILDLNEYAE